MKTINDILVNGQMAEDYFTEKLGYDRAKFDYARIFHHRETTLNFTLEDDFQRKLPESMKYKDGIFIYIEAEGFWKTLEAWPTREQRELTILARKATALDADLSLIRSAQVHAFVAKMQPVIEDLRRQIAHDPTVEIK